MSSLFDQVIPRVSTAAVKWDGRETRFRVADVLPMWVADMDFSAPPAVIDAFRERVEHGVFGYTMRTDTYFEAMVDWFERRHHWTLHRESIAHAPGVVPGIGFLFEALSEPGDSIVIQPPVYHPFRKIIQGLDRVVSSSPLRLDGERYHMDLDSLRDQFASGARLWILCSPHNPVGRVWSAEELRAAGELAVEFGVTVISDEIHCDLVFGGHTHTPFASLSDTFAQHSVTCVAPSKTFNIAGLQTAAMVIPNPDLRKKYIGVLQKYWMNGANTFGAIAFEAAYKAGDAWLDELLRYLEGNLETLERALEEKMPQIRVIHPEGTYLVWLDCRGLGLDKKALDHFFLYEAGVGLDEGHIFGSEGIGFQRMNIACPRVYVEEAVNRIAAAWQRRLG